MGRRIPAAILICAVMVIATAVPVLASTHLITKGQKGSNANAVTWEYAPVDDGIWTGHVANNGLKSLVIEVCDNTTGVPREIMQQKIRFAACDAFPTGSVDTTPVVVFAGCTYSITATPSGPKGAYCMVDDKAVPSKVASLSPPHSDHGLDSDADGKYNYLAIDVSVEVREAGNFTIDIDLYDSASQFIVSSSGYRYLAQGSQIVEVLLNGWTILNSGLDGPYVAMINMTDHDGNWLDSDTYHTTAYSCDQFQSSLAELAPPHSDYGLDTDSDGLYNFLVVDVSVAVFVAGSYTVNSTLYDKWSEIINWLSVSACLESGAQTIQIQFKGHTIRNSESDGPYLATLELTTLDGHPLDSGTYTTQAYSWSQFQHPVVEFAPPHSDYGMDANGDGLYEWLVIDVSLSVSVAESYTLSVNLYDKPWTGAYVGFAYNVTYLESGLQTAQLFVPGYQIYNSGISGPYWAFLSMGGPDGYWLQNGEHYTQAYSWSQFQPTPM
jgi:hypothetical protein